MRVNGRTEIPPKTGDKAIPRASTSWVRGGAGLCRPGHPRVSIAVARPSLRIVIVDGSPRPPEVWKKPHNLAHRPYAAAAGRMLESLD